MARSTPERIPNAQSEMPRGESEFEEKRIHAEFSLSFGRLSHLIVSTLSDAHEFSFRMGYMAVKAAVLRKQDLSHETISSPLDASVRETAGANKEKQNGITTSD